MLPIFLDALKDGGMVADGAMGSLLYERGIFVNRNFDQLNLSQGALVQRIHVDYLKAGAALLETNTYGAHPLRLLRHDLHTQAQAINQTGVKLALDAAGDAAYVAGSMGPTGLGPAELRRQENEVYEGFANQALWLTEAGCGLLLIETFVHPHELRLAIQAARKATPLPIVAHVVVNNSGLVADGSCPGDLAEEMASWGADVVGVNCNSPDMILDAAQKMVAKGLHVSAMPNAGRPQSIEDRLIYLATPENFGVYARRLFKAGVKLVGGCCGTNPSHIRRVAAAARMVVPTAMRIKKHGSVQEKACDPSLRQPAQPLALRTPLGSKLGQRFVVSVEVNPGIGLSIEKPMAAAKMLCDAGADVINIADGPRATVRMANHALAQRMQEDLGIETLLHVCCRDRNLLGLQADILANHVMGLHNLVVITGDPPKIGDYPDATAVYDIDSIGLLEMLSGFNQGVDAADKACQPTRFVLATGAEPAALNFEKEIMRLRQKVAAGADAIMTQPVYDIAQIDRFLAATSDLDVPVLVGILPLASAKNADFIHQNIPGMRIPEEIRKRMHSVASGPKSRAEGIRIATESLMAIRDRVAGAYIMPPLGKYDMAAEILSAIGNDRSLGQNVPGRCKQPGSAA